MTTSVARATAFAAFAGLVVFACAEREALVMLGSGFTDDGGGPAFTPPAADADAPADASSTLSLCTSTECPYPYATCLVQGQPPPYRCATNLTNDSANCGVCGHACESLPGEFHVDLTCVAAVCQAVCRTGALDCNGIPDDGCEVIAAEDPNNCGACGVRCDPGVQCRGGHCGCPPGTTECNGKCTDLDVDDTNCGACDVVCPPAPPERPAPPPHMYYGCGDAHCGELKCIKYWANCNGKLEDGCEINLDGSDPNNCGQCGNKCAPGKACFGFGGTLDCQCPTGYSICYGNSCRDLASDPANCGSCDYICPEQGSNTRTICDRGRCGSECRPGFADCNGNVEDGCEVDLSKDPRNCGTCGVACDNAAGQPCVNGECAMQACDGGGPPR